MGIVYKYHEGNVKRTLKRKLQVSCHLLSFQQFQVLVTFFSKSFSHFPHGTCTLSVSNIYLASNKIYHLLCTPIPRNTILGSIPCMMACTHTFISNTTLKYNSKHKVQIVNVSSSGSFA